MTRKAIGGRIGRIGTFLLLVAVVATTMSAVALAKPARQTSGVVYAGVTHAEGSDVYVAGDIKDKILGRGAIVYVTELSSGEEPSTLLVEARKITIYTTHGSLTGKGQATQTNNPDGTSTVTDGTFRLTRGTGDYKDHTLIGTFEGTGSTDGVYTFNYTGRYR